MLVFQGVVLGSVDIVHKVVTSWWLETESGSGELRVRETMEATVAGFNQHILSSYPVP